MIRNDFVNRSTEMNLIQEDLARAHMDARLSQARELRRSYQLTRAQRLARKAERATQQSRLTTLSRWSSSVTCAGRRHPASPAPCR